MAEFRQLTINGLGGKGDGFAEHDDGRVFIPGALPGEVWRRTVDGTFALVTASAARAVPPCAHFGTCGGCIAQHMDDDLYVHWKTAQVTDAFALQGLAIEAKPLWRAGSGTRRRVTFSAEIRSGKALIGFRAAGSHDLVAIEMCPVAEPRIVAALPLLRDLSQVAAAKGQMTEARISVLAADNGLDVAIDSDPVAPLDAATRQALANTALAGGVVRLTIDGHEVMQLGKPRLAMGGVDVEIPPGVFLQAFAAAEAFMAQQVVKALGRARAVADLFCGVGAFSFPIAARARVHACDSDPGALGALSHAMRHAKGLKPIEVRRRDLFREPLSRGELAAFDGVVFDPPRAGAIAQATALAKSKVPVVAAVSCHPATLARDARVLIDGGYRLESVQPIDQFVYSSHVEVVAVFRR